MHGGDSQSHWYFHWEPELIAEFEIYWSALVSESIRINAMFQRENVLFPRIFQTLECDVRCEDQFHFGYSCPCEFFQNQTSFCYG